MSKFSNKKFMGSVEHAFKGLSATFKSQRNFKYQLLVMLAIFVVAFFLKYSVVEVCLCGFTIMVVLIVEMLNSSIEFALDSVYKNKYSVLVKLAKDICAGAVLLSSINCVAINAIIFFSKIYILFK